jgi:hypothetical protein
MVVARGYGREGMGSYHLMGVKVHFRKVKTS